MVDFVYALKAGGNAISGTIEMDADSMTGLANIQ